MSAVATLPALTAEELLRFDPAWLHAEGIRRGHRLPPWAPAPGRRSPDDYAADSIAYCTRRGCFMGLAYWEDPPTAQRKLYRAWVDRSATLECAAARPRALIEPALRQGRRQARRRLLDAARAAGHVMGPWTPFYLSFVKHTLVYESRCRDCGAHILAGLCAPHPDYATTFLEADSGYGYDSYAQSPIHQRCPGANSHQLTLF